MAAAASLADEGARFERLLADLSARFVSFLPAEVDREIENGLRQIVEGPGRGPLQPHGTRRGRRAIHHNPSVGQGRVARFGEIGSGVLISQDGKVVTASHVVHGMEDITVEFVGRDPARAQFTAVAAPSLHEMQRIALPVDPAEVSTRAAIVERHGRATSPGSRRFQPILDGESGHAPELTLVVGDERCADVPGMGGDQQVIWPDRPSGPLEARPNLPVVGAGGGGEVVELEQIEKLVEGPAPLLAYVTGGQAVVDLGDGDRRESDLAGRAPGDPPRDVLRARRSIDEVPDGVGVELRLRPIQAGSSKD